MVGTEESVTPVVRLVPLPCGTMAKGTYICNVNIYLCMKPARTVYLRYSKAHTADRGETDGFENAAARCQGLSGSRLSRKRGHPGSPSWSK